MDDHLYFGGFLKIKIAFKLLVLVLSSSVLFTVCGNDAVTSASTRPFSIGGTVSGTSATGGLVLQNNGSDALHITATGAFTFPTYMANGSGYNVQVKTQPTSPAGTCAVANAYGTVTGASITNVTVTCTP